MVTLMRENELLRFRVRVNKTRYICRPNSERSVELSRVEDDTNLGDSRRRAICIFNILRKAFIAFEYRSGDAANLTCTKPASLEKTIKNAFVALSEGVHTSPCLTIRG